MSTTKTRRKRNHTPTGVVAKQAQRVPEPEVQKPREWVPTPVYQAVVEQLGYDPQPGVDN